MPFSSSLRAPASDSDKRSLSRSSTRSRLSAFFGRRSDDGIEARQASPPHQYGINVFSEPVGPAAVDIVFVHGLHGHIQRTWLHKKSNIHWPRDLLPQDMPDARILGFSYDADIVHFWSRSPASTARLTNHAEAMIGQLLRQREASDTINRPLIFIAHSLGGLVTQCALRLSSTSASPRLQTLEKCTKGIVFLGTPNLGSDLASLGSLAASLANLTVSANKDIVGVLKPDSEVTRMIQTDFYNLLNSRISSGKSLDVTCFFEELEVPGAGLIVPFHSAQIQGYPCYGIHEDHMDMTKFADRNGNSYKQILGELKRWKADASGLSGRFPDYNASKVTDSQYLTRQSAFQLMDKFFNSPRTNTAACLIHALAGSGKTQLAKGFAQKRSENGLKAYFLDASSSETLTQGFISFARSASLCPERDFASISSKELMPVVLRFLEALPHKWLLVYDNYDVFEGELGFDIGEFLPKSKWGSIIVTSRNAGVQRLLPEDCVRLELGNLSSQEGVELFAKRLRLSESRLSQQSRDLISTICTDLAVGMPLAISQSASFVLQSSRSLDDLEGSLQRYISDYASHQEELLSGKRDSYVREYGLSVMTTFNLSLRTVRAKNPHAANLLLLCGNFHHSGIQKKWFHNLCEARDRHETLGLDLSLPENEWFREMMSVEPGSGWDDFGLRTALGTLQDYDLIRLSDDSIEWNLHPLIHASCPAHAQEAFGEHYEAQVSLAAILIVANYDLKDDWADLLLIQCREHLTSHIEAWLKVATSSTSLLELAERPKNTPQVMNLLDALYDPKDTSRIVRDAVRARFRAVDVFYTSKRQIFAHIAIRKLVAWLVEYYEPKGGVVWHTLAMLRSQIEQEETRAPDDTQVKIAHARLYWSLVADCPDDEKLKVVEEGLQYLEANEAYLPAFDVLEIKETLYSNQFTNSKSDKDKRKAIKMLDAVSADLSGLVGPNHPAVLSRPIYTPIELRSRASRTDVMELSSRVRSTLKSRQGAGVQTYLLEQLLLFSDEDHGEDSPESVKLLNDLRNLEAVYDGKWSTPALTSTCDYYLRLDILKGGRHALTPISSFKSSWKQIPGVDFYLVCSIIAALGMHVYGPVFDIPLLWEGIRVESQQALSRLDRLRDSITAFKALEEFLLVKHADADASVVARLHRELEIATLPDTKQLIGRRIASLPKLAELWSSLTDLERTIISPDTRVQGVHEKKSGELERRIISHFHQSTSLTRLDLCVMAVFFFLHLIWKYPEYTILSSGFLDQFRLLVGAITSPQDSPRQHWLTVEIFVWQQLDNKEKSTRALCELEVNAVNERKADIDYKLNTGMTLDVNVGSASEGCLREAEVKNDLALGHVELSAVRLLDEIRREFSHRDWNTAVLASFQRHSTVWCERVDFVHAASEAALFSDLSNAARACDFTHDWQTLWTLFRLFEQHLVNLPTKSWWYCFAQLRWVLDDLLVDGMWRRAVICVAHWMSDVLEERSKSEDSLTDLDKFGARFQLQHRICEAYGELGYEWNVEQGTQELNALERQIRESLGEAVSIERRQGFEKMLESRTAYWEEKRRSNTTEDGPA